MNKKKQLIENQIINGSENYYQNISVDNVIFGYDERNLKVLLLRPQSFKKWLLPGGYVLKTETVEEAATRVLRYRTKLDEMFLKQFKVFSDPNRSKDDYFNQETFSKLLGFELDKNHWMFENFISIGFFALTNYSLVHPNADWYNEELSWWNLDSLPDLSFDHEKIVEDALIALKLSTYHHPIGNELLPEKFTLPEIHALYETILGRKLDIRNFAKKLINLGVIIKLNEQKSIGAHRSPYLYKFDLEKYHSFFNGNDVLVV